MSNNRIFLLYVLYVKYEIKSKKLFYIENGHLAKKSLRAIEKKMWNVLLWMYFAIIFFSPLES